MSDFSVPTAVRYENNGFRGLIAVLIQNNNVFFSGLSSTERLTVDVSEDIVTYIAGSILQAPWDDFVFHDVRTHNGGYYKALGTFEVLRLEIPKGAGEPVVMDFVPMAVSADLADVPGNRFVAVSPQVARDVLVMFKRYIEEPFQA